jgi:hypothetical protein
MAPFSILPIKPAIKHISSKQPLTTQLPLVTMRPVHTIPL